MKKQITKPILIATLALISLSNFVQAQSDEKSFSPHNGIEFTMNLGAIATKIKGNIEGIGDAALKGPTISFCFHGGYAANNWSSGLSGCVNSLSLNSVTINGEDMDAAEDGISIDNSLYGLYVTKYFMPINMYVSTDLGVGKFTIYDANGEVVSETQAGFAWDVRAGKEFLLGKKKHFGIGAYASFGGLRCHDSEPYNNDVYSYLGPGGGLSLSYQFSGLRRTK